MKTNNRGQFSIVAALLVAVILVATVISTYSAIRYSTIQDQPQVLTAVDETNLALKQLLGYTVGYYGSILQVTGNATYAQEDTQYGAKSYLQRGLQNIVDIHPDWGLSLNVTSIDLNVDWFSTASYSAGSMSVKYDLAGLGLYGITYAPQCRLDIEVLSSVSGSPASVRVMQDEEEPLNTLTLQNFKFYNYSNSDQMWNLIDPPNEPEVSSNGTYTINVPLGIDSSMYLIQVKDDRGLMVVGSSFNAYDSTFTLDSSSAGVEHYIDQASDVYAPPEVGTHSDFSLQNAKDGNCDLLTEENVGGIISFINSESFEGAWPPSLPSYWTETGSWNKENNRAYTGTYSADFDGPSLYYDPSASGDLTTPDFDCSGSITSITVDFWYRDEGVDSGEFVLKYYDGSSWDLIAQLGIGNENQWIHYHDVITDSQYFKSSFKVRWSAVSVDYNEHAYVDLVTITKNVPATFQLDLEEQFTNVDYSQTMRYLCIRPGNLGSEPLEVDVRFGSSWIPVTYNLQTALVDSWFNVSVSTWLTGATFTIRFLDGQESGDTTQSTWEIDAVLLRLSSEAGLLPVKDSTTVVEWLQNGTMRWLGQNLDLTTEAKPIPPIPVRAIRLNQTFVNGTIREVPFQVEDWAADYSIPLGLTSSVTIVSNRQMVVFILTSEVVEVTLWWDGRDTATQTPLAYTNTIFTQDNPNNGFLSNGILSLAIGSEFRVTSTKGSSSSVSTFMRINNEDSIYGAGEAIVIHHGIVRDVVQQEAEWEGGADGCPNIYANIVLTLPAGASYYTYQLKLMFIDSSTQTRTITDLVPLQLSTSPSSPIAQTENGTIGSTPRVANGTGTFRDYSGSGSTKHQWSQIMNNVTGVGAGIMFTTLANQQLYFFDSIAGGSTGALNVSSTARTIELAPVTSLHAVSNYNTPSGAEVTWYGAVATFDGSTSPIYDFNNGSPLGLWMLIENLPMATVTAER
jgi:hypothetical protein